VEHQHKFNESFYVIEGTLTVEINGQTRQVPAGSYVFIPGGMRHAQGNKGTTPVRNIVTTTPAGLEPMFRRRAEEYRKANPAKP
jgi:quercetin dioxygenase-like cupin family protein